MNNTSVIESEILDLKISIAAMELAMENCCFIKTAESLKKEIHILNKKLKVLERGK
jgi:hypothetical protein